MAQSIKTHLTPASKAFSSGETDEPLRGALEFSSNRRSLSGMDLTRERWCGTGR